MGEVVRLHIDNREHELTIKEYQGQRVVTFKDIDEVHGRPDGTAGRNFRENRDKFIHNEDYFYLTGEELAAYKQTTNFVGSNAKELILITESGYLMLTKSLNDDLAWQIQRQLVNTYFRAKEVTKITTLNEFKQKEIEVRLKNARAREANILLKIADKPEVPSEFKQVLYSYASQIITGQPLLPLPKTEKTYTAEEIAKELGISANRVGRIANKHGIKTPEYGIYVWDKSPYSPKQVQAWRYNEAGRERIKELVNSGEGI
ncbi:ORF6N domain-containing protein [Thermoanaerobacterium sp. DL9XJH110]|uniref:ORF6N domain-containing protein n=1 Tax=Thermoanaerobacterium sp. DL9XJH110 TaxID=3386643 RepID=UPI003BB48FE0